MVYKNRGGRRDIFKTARSIADFKFRNKDIKAFNICVIDEDGKNLGEMKRYDALNLAQEKGLDIVQINYDRRRQVSTAKLVDLGQFLYEKKKKDKQKRKQQRSHIMKQVKISYSTGENDLNRQIGKAREFLIEGHLVKISIFLKGREIMFKAKARDKLKDMQKELSDVGKPQFKYPKEGGRGYFISLNPLKNG